MKKILFGIALTMAAVSAQASYLYWQLDETVTMANTGSTYTFDDDSFNSATVYAVKGDKKTALTLGEVDSSGQFKSLGMTEIGSAGEYLVDLGSLVGDGYSYYVEYIGFNSATGNFGQIGYGETSTYDQLVQQGAIVGYNDTSLHPIDQATIWHGGTANAPEPTSAMLMLLGVAGLALRRKQRKLA